MSQRERVYEILEELRRSRDQCEDCWYSCPKSGDCCNDNQKHDECNCGADRHNALVEELRMHLRNML